MKAIVLLVVTPCRAMPLRQGIFAKFLCTLVIAMLSVFQSLGQGTIQFQNGTTSRVYGYSSTGLVPLGSQFFAGLYYAPDGETDEAEFIMLGSAARFIDSPTAPTGIFIGGNRTAPTATPGGFGMFQVRAWTAAYGNSYETAIANCDVCTGRSSIMRIDTGDPTTTPPGVAAPLRAFGLTSFTVGNLGAIECPEPGTCSLGLVAGCALFLHILRVRNRR